MATREGQAVLPFREEQRALVDNYWQGYIKFLEEELNRIG